MKEKKAMTQEIWQISILHPKTSKEFYHHVQDFGKVLWKAGVPLKNLHLNISQYSQKNTCEYCKIF